MEWSCSPACTELEAVMCDWAARLLGLDAIFQNESGVGGGVIQVSIKAKMLVIFQLLSRAEEPCAIQTTASDSALTAVVAARSRYMRKHPDTDLSRLVIYTTSQTHSLGAKAALVLGLSVRALDVKLEDNLALTGETLRAAYEEDIASERHPFILSTN